MDSEGLAVKLVVMQFIQVSIASLIITKILNITFDIYYLLGILAAIVGFSFVLKFLTFELGDFHFALQIMVFVILYVFLLVFSLLKYPSVLSFNKNDLGLIYGKCKKRFTHAHE